MATEGIINGTNLRIYAGGTVIGNATSCTLTVSREMREILTKDSPGNGWTENKPGRKSGTLSTEGLASTDTANRTPKYLFDALNNGTPIVLRFTTDVVGDTYWEGSGYCSSFESTAAVEENATYPAEFTVHGAITSGTES